MLRIARSEQFRQEWQEVLAQGNCGEGEGLLDALIRTGARYMLQVAIEEEVTDFLGREHYQRGDRSRQGYRNGYEPKRLVTGQGAIEVGIPQLRNTDEPFHSELLAAFTNRSGTLEELVRRMYVRGLSRQDVADAFAEAFDERVMSKSTVSRVARAI